MTIFRELQNEGRIPRFMLKSVNETSVIGGRLIEMEEEIAVEDKGMERSETLPGNCVSVAC